MKRIVAAKVEQIIEFDSDVEMSQYINFMRASDPQFELIEHDERRIRIVKSYNKNKMLITESGLQNEKEGN